MNSQSTFSRIHKKLLFSSAVVPFKVFIGLTCGFIWVEWLVDKAMNFGHIVKIRMLSNERPLRVIELVVEIGNGYLNTPVILVIFFYVPMHSDWTHVFCAV